MDKYVHIGGGNFINSSKILAIHTPDSAPVKRLIKAAKENNRYIDLSSGKKVRSIVVKSSENGSLILFGVHLNPVTAINRLNGTIKLEELEKK